VYAPDPCGPGGDAAPGRGVSIPGESLGKSAVSHAASGLFSGGLMFRMIGGLCWTYISFFFVVVFFASSSWPHVAGVIIRRRGWTDARGKAAGGAGVLVVVVLLWASVGARLRRPHVRITAAFLRAAPVVGVRVFKTPGELDHQTGRPGGTAGGPPVGRLPLCSIFPPENVRGDHRFLLQATRSGPHVRGGQLTEELFQLAAARRLASPDANCRTRGTRRLQC